jgi:hypothetical protein
MHCPRPPPSAALPPPPAEFPVRELGGHRGLCHHHVSRTLTSLNAHLCTLTLYAQALSISYESTSSNVLLLLSRSLLHAKSTSGSSLTWLDTSHADFACSRVHTPMVQIVLNAEKRKKADLKLESGEKVKAYLYYDGEPVTGTVRHFTSRRVPAHPSCCPFPSRIPPSLRSSFRLVTLAR